MHELLLRIELLGTAIPVAVGFIHSLRLRFPIFLLQIFPNIKHPQQGVLGEHRQMSTPRNDPLCILLLGVVPGRSVQPWGSGGHLKAWRVPGCLWKLDWRCHPRISPLGILQSEGCSGSTPTLAATSAGGKWKAVSTEMPTGPLLIWDAPLIWMQGPLTWQCLRVPQAGAWCRSPGRVDRCSWELHGGGGGGVWLYRWPWPFC